MEYFLFLLLLSCFKMDQWKKLKKKVIEIRRKNELARRKLREKKGIREVQIYLDQLGITRL